MKAIVFIEDSFDSAHWLPNVPENHKCHRMHGHTYRLHMEFIGDIGETSGWVADYETLRKSWAPVKATLDHRVLNEIPGLENPTCELLVNFIAASLGPAVTRIELRETVNCGVVWERPLHVEKPVQVFQPDPNLVALKTK